MLVRIDTLVEWKGEPLPYTTNRAQIHRQDGTVEDVEVKPYTFDVRLPPNIDVLWTDDELWAMGLARPRPVEVPEGKMLVGTPQYEKHDGYVQTVQEMTDIDTTPVEVVDLTPQEKLARAGLTREDLLAILETK